MGLEHPITEQLSDGFMLPTCGQGALVLNAELMIKKFNYSLPV